MLVVEEIRIRAEKLAREMNITVAKAYGLVLESNPGLYAAAMEERANAGPAGTSGSLEYARKASRSGMLRGPA
jgi:hypothetical protein